MSGALEEKLVAGAAVKAAPEDRIVLNNPAPKALTIAPHVLEGEIALTQGRAVEAVGHLKEVVKVEDTLRYDEPPDRMRPARHALGAVLRAAGRAREAEQVQRGDLKKGPGNGWTLFGLAQALRKHGSAGAGGGGARFKKGWMHADITTGPSCLCVKGASTTRRCGVLLMIALWVRSMERGAMMRAGARCALEAHRERA